ncbi:MAG: hypothetical protein Q9218_005723 [Villophora microphyllina]
MYLRQMIRLQYQWTLPLETGCTQSIPQRHVENTSTINSAREFEDTIQQGRLHEIKFMRLNFNNDTHAYAISQRGSQYLYQGQGPIWDQNSCHLDCCIVAARLLNVGSTAADNGGKPRESWLQSLGSVPRNFLRLLSEKWESMDRQANIARRHNFWDKGLPQLVEGTPNRSHFAPASRVWDLCTSQMEQFSFVTRESWSECRHCEAAPIIHDSRCHQSLSLDISRSMVDDFKEQFKGQPPLAEWIGREFKVSPRRCGKCRTPDGRSRKREIVGDMPPRLVVVPGELTQDSIAKATSNNVRFAYCSTKGDEEVAYRWLGGIYHSKRHFRLYWTDDEAQFPKESIKIYDGLCAFGAIIGGIPIFAAKRDEKVPAPWSKGPVVLFYERIDQVALQSAKERLEADLVIALSLESKGTSIANFLSAAQHLSGPEMGDPTGLRNDTGSHDGLRSPNENTETPSRPHLGDQQGESNDPAEKDTTNPQEVNEDDNDINDQKEDGDTNKSNTNDELSNKTKDSPIPPSRSQPESPPKSPNASTSNAESLLSRLSPSSLLNCLRRSASPPPLRTQQRQRSLPPPDLLQFDGGNDESAKGFKYDHSVSGSEDVDDIEMSDDELASTPPSSTIQIISPRPKSSLPSSALRRSTRILEPHASHSATRRERLESERVGILKASNINPQPAVHMTRGHGDPARQTITLQSVKVSHKRSRSESLNSAPNGSRNGDYGKGVKKVRFDCNV